MLYDKKLPAPMSPSHRGIKNTYNHIHGILFNKFNHSDKRSAKSRPANKKNHVRNKNKMRSDAFTDADVDTA